MIEEVIEAIKDPDPRRVTAVVFVRSFDPPSKFQAAMASILAAARRIYDSLKARQSTLHLRRLRMLPSKIDSESGYGISGYVIRRHPSKDAQAQMLKGLLDPLVQPAHFELRPSAEVPPWCLGAFACPAN